MAYDRRTSIHGRRLALNSTGAIVDFNGYGALMKNSTGAIQSSSSALTYAGSLAVDDGFTQGVQTASSSGTTFSAFGLSILSSATATDRNFTMPTPVAGRFKEIVSASSATTIVIETTVASITFVTTGTSSTKLTLSLAGGVFGAAIELRGMSATRWAVLNKTGETL